jgi:hypothetical protein
MEHEGLLTHHVLHGIAKEKSAASAGADGWSGAEVASWPPAAWQKLLELWQRWVAAGVLPLAWRHSRQVHIEKKAAAVEGTPVEGLRPITIQAAAARILASAMARAAREWAKAQADVYTHGALAGRSLEAAVLAIDGHLDQGGILVSLDLEKCFDRMDPSLAVAIMQRRGFPKQWATHLQCMWGSQWRWLQVGRFTHPEAQAVSTSTPQGCALAPIALVCMLAEAAADTWPSWPRALPPDRLRGRSGLRGLHSHSSGDGAASLG